MDTIKLAKLLEELLGDGSAEDLAEKIGIPPQSLRNYINRPSSQPGIDKLVKIANYMGITLDELGRKIGLDIKTKPSYSVPRINTAEDAYLITKNLNSKSRIDLCARLLAETSAAYNAG